MASTAVQVGYSHLGALYLSAFMSAFMHVLSAFTPVFRSLHEQCLDGVVAKVTTMIQVLKQPIQEVFIAHLFTPLCRWPWPAR